MKNNRNEFLRITTQKNANRFSRIFAFYFAITFVSIFIFFTIAYATTTQELRDSISEKSAELKQIDSERQQIFDNLNTLNKESQSLQKDIKKNDYQISQLSLTIKSSEVTIEKLSLESESLNDEIKDIEIKSDTKKETIVNLLRELDEKENEGFLNIFLKNQSLADSISGVQRLVDLNAALTADISVLRSFHDERTQKLNNISQKKREQESENTNLQNRKFIVEDQKKERQTFLASNKQQEKTYQKRINELEKLQAEIGAEIDKIENELRSKIDPSILPVARSGVLAMPLNVDLNQNLTQIYGATAFAQQAYSSGFHNGIDIGAPVGTAIFAAENGRVIAVGNTDKYCPPVWYGRKKYGGSYGKYIMIKHENNLSTLYAHLSLQVVEVGDIVNRGELIGYTGNTGFSTGPHIHFTVYANIYNASDKLLSPEIKNSVHCGPQPYGGTLNPLDYL